MGPGADWKERREEMGKTLEEASQEVRISQKYLRGIEEGNYSRWPPKVFSTGFIRAYATFLSVNPNPVLSDYFSFLEKRSIEEPPLHTRPEWLDRERQRGSRRTAYTIATVAVLAIGVFLAWYARHTALRPLPATEVRETTPSPSPAVPASGEAPAMHPATRRGGAKRRRSPPRQPSGRR